MKMRVVTAAVALALLAAAAAPPVSAETLDLERCLKIALDVSPTVGVSRENLAQARAGVLQSYGSFLPSLGVNLWSGHTFVGPSQGVQVDSQGRAIKPTGFNFENYSFSVSGNMTLWNWGANYKQVEVAKEYSTAAGHDLEYTKDVIRATVIREYYDLVRQRRLRKVQEDAVQASQRNLEQVEAFYKIGSRTKADMLQARVTLANDQLALLNAKNAEALAETRLKSLLNMPLDAELDIDDSIEFETEKVDLDSEVQYMLDHRSDLLASRQRLQAARNSVTAAKARRYPSLNGNFSYGWNDRRFAEDANFFRQDYSWSVGVSLSYNIFDRFQTRSDVMNAEAGRRIAEYNLQQAKLDAILDVKQIVLNLDQAQERLGLAEETVAQAQENMRLAEERYRVGAGTILETIQASASLTSAQASLIEARIDYLINRADLARATGRPIVD